MGNAGGNGHIFTYIIFKIDGEIINTDNKQILFLCRKDKTTNKITSDIEQDMGEMGEIPCLQVF